MSLSNLSLNLNQDFNLPVYENLCAAPQDKLFYNKHKFDHPADIFSKKFTTILYLLKQLIEVIPKDENNIDFESKLRNYIEELDTFYDNLFCIIKCFEPDNPNIKAPSAEAWLKLVGNKNATDFKGAVSQEHSIIRKISNKLKHSTCHIRKFYLTWDEFPDKEVYGFFIGCTRDDYIMPDPDIHEKYRNSYTGFSFNHFILTTIGKLYYYSNCLNYYLFNGNELYSSEKKSYFYELLEIAIKIEKLFFPDEYSKPIPILQKNKDEIIIEYPTAKRERKPTNTSRRIHSEIILNFRTGVAQEYIPYFSIKD